MSLLGAHISIAGGVENAPSRGKEIGCQAIQIFTANQTRWKSKPFSEKNIKGFREKMEAGEVQICLSHDSYLINLGSPKEDILKKSRLAFLEEIDRCEALGIPYIIFHPGSHLGSGESRCLQTIAHSLNFAMHERPDSSVTFLLETTAGQGTNVGYKFEHLRDIMGLVQEPDRMGVCLDTCHIFAAGYDIRTEEGWKNTLNEFDEITGMEKLKAFHLNDSKRDLGSGVDRHEKIGQGKLGLECFRVLVNEPGLKNIPMTLETPASDYHEYAEEIALLKSLMDKKKQEK